MPWLGSVGAVVEAWYPGQTVRHGAGAGALRRRQPLRQAAGDVPQERRADARARTRVEYPGDGDDVYYSEGLLVGYRWYDATGRSPLFPFGYGLSYTSFRIVRPVRGPAWQHAQGEGHRDGTPAAARAPRSSSSTSGRRRPRRNRRGGSRRTPRSASARAVPAGHAHRRRSRRWPPGTTRTPGGSCTGAPTGSTSATPRDRCRSRPRSASGRDRVRTHGEGRTAHGVLPSPGVRTPPASFQRPCSGADGPWRRAGSGISTSRPSASCLHTRGWQRRTPGPRVSGASSSGLSQCCDLARTWCRKNRHMRSVASISNVTGPRAGWSGMKASLPGQVCPPPATR